MDRWILWVSIALPIVFAVVLILWHVVAPHLGKLFPRRRKRRQAPEPPPWGRFTKPPPSEQVSADVSHVEQPLASAGAEESESNQHTREALALVNSELCNSRVLSCLERCEKLAATFPDLHPAQEARQLAAQIKADLEQLRRACLALVDSLGEKKVPAQKQPR